MKKLMENKVLLTIIAIIGLIVVVIGLLFLMGFPMGSNLEVGNNTSTAVESITEEDIQEMIDSSNEDKKEEEKITSEDGGEDGESLLTQETVCRVIHESVISDEMNHVSTSGAWLHVEYYISGQPERETILNASEAAGGRYNFDESHGQIIGWVWEYADCTFEEVRAQVKAHIPRRIAGGANNDGFYAFDFEHEDAGKIWHPTNLFLPFEAEE